MSLSTSTSSSANAESAVSGSSQNSSSNSTPPTTEEKRALVAKQKQAELEQKQKKAAAEEAAKKLAETNKRTEERKKEESNRMSILREALKWKDNAEMEYVTEDQIKGIEGFQDLSKLAQKSIIRQWQAQKTLDGILDTGFFTDNSYADDKTMALSQNKNEDSPSKPLQYKHIIVNGNELNNDFLQNEETKDTFVKSNGTPLTQTAIESFVDVHAAKFASSGDKLPVVTITGFGEKTRRAMTFALLQRGLLPKLPKDDYEMPVPSSCRPSWYYKNSWLENPFAVKPEGEEGDNAIKLYNQYMKDIGDEKKCNTWGRYLAITESYLRNSGAIFSESKGEAPDKKTTMKGDFEMETKTPTVTSKNP